MENRDILAVRLDELKSCTFLRDLNLNKSVDYLFQRDFVRARNKMAILAGVSDYSYTSHFLSEARDVGLVKETAVIANLNTEPDLSIARSFLHKAGYQDNEIILMRNVTKKQILDTIQQIPRNCSLFLFLAGHGLMVDSVHTCFVPSDARLTFSDIVPVVARDIGVAKKPISINSASTNLISGKDIRSRMPSKTCLIADICHAEGFVKNANPSIGIYSSLQSETAIQGFGGYTRDVVALVTQLKREVCSPGFDMHTEGGVFSNAFFQLAKSRGLKDTINLTNNFLSRQHAGFFGHRKYLDKQGKKVLAQKELARMERKQFVEQAIHRIRTLKNAYDALRQGGDRSTYLNNISEVQNVLRRAEAIFKDEIYNDAEIVREHKEILDLIVVLIGYLDNIRGLLNVQQYDQSRLEELINISGQDSIRLLKITVRYFRKIMDYDKQVQEIFCKFRNMLS